MLKNQKKPWKSPNNTLKNPRKALKTPEISLKSPEKNVKKPYKTPKKLLSSNLYLLLSSPQISFPTFLQWVLFPSEGSGIVQVLGLLCCAAPGGKGVLLGMLFKVRARDGGRAAAPVP